MAAPPPPDTIAGAALRRSRYRRSDRPPARTAALLTTAHNCIPLRTSMDITTNVRYSAHVVAESKQHTPRVSVLLSREEFERLDAYCAQFGHKKSTLIARLIRDFLNQQKFEAGDDTE